MYARSTTIQGTPSSLDAGIAHVRDEVLPAVSLLDGCVGLSMMLDRDTGRCVVTTAWQSEEAMRASAQQVTPIRSRAAEILGGTPQVEEWEIAVMHREHPTHPGAWVRAPWLQTDPGSVDGLVEIYKSFALPQLDTMDGFCSASFLINRGTGRAVSSASFADRATLEASREQTQRIRSEGTQRGGATVLEVGEFELAMAHLRVPEAV